MSGGTWDYRNLHMGDIAEDLELRSNDEDLYSEETRSLMKQLAFNTKLIGECLHDADYLIAGDIGEEDFNERTQQNIAKFNMLETLKYVKCKCCGKIFVRTTTNQMYCSVKCRRKAQNLRFQKKHKKVKK